MKPTLPFIEPSLVCRPALPMDRPAMLKIASQIWGGNDYIPLVWDEWLADPHGVFAAAEFGGQIAGLGKLTRQAEDQWWIEGLRVPTWFEGRGFASHIMDYLLSIWQRHSSGVIRLSTPHFQTAVHRMSLKRGFTQVGEWGFYAAPALPGGVNSFDLVRESGVEAAAQMAAASPTLLINQGFYDLGWQWMKFSSQLLQEAAARKQAWWWKGAPPDGLLAAHPDEDDDDHVEALVLQLLACQSEQMAACLADFRRLAGSLGYERAGWVAPLVPVVTAALDAAGFRPHWDFSLYIFEKRA